MLLTIAVAKDVGFRSLPCVLETEPAVESVGLWLGLVRVELLVDPQDDVIVGGGGDPGQVQNAKLRGGHRINMAKSPLRVYQAVITSILPLCRRACDAVVVVAGQPVLNEQGALLAPSGLVDELLRPLAVRLRRVSTDRRREKGRVELKTKNVNPRYAPQMRSLIILLGLLRIPSAASAQDVSPRCERRWIARRGCHWVPRKSRKLRFLQLTELLTLLTIRRRHC